MNNPSIHQATTFKAFDEVRHVSAAAGRTFQPPANIPSIPPEAKPETRMTFGNSSDSPWPNLTVVKAKWKV
jgi:hypothetical protein